LHSNYGSISYRFRDKQRFQSKIAKKWQCAYTLPSEQ